MLPWWLQYLKAVALVLIPPIGAWIAWQQMHIASVRLKFDLYQKRYAVFEAARRLLAEVHKHSNYLDFKLEAYDLETSDAVFLHPDKLSEYLRELRNHAAKLSDLNGKIGSFPTAGESELSKKRDEELEWFNNQMDELVEHFKPFLKLDKSKFWQVWRLPFR